MLNNGGKYRFLGFFYLIVCGEINYILFLYMLVELVFVVLK